MRWSTFLVLSSVAAACGSAPAPDAFTGSESTTSGDGDTADFIPSETGETGDEKGPLGAPCDTDEECQDDLHCNADIPTYGGHCSDCGDDEDCVELRLGINCTFTGVFFECSDGLQGEMCDNDEGCEDGLTCELLLELGAVFDAHFCSTCGVDADCPNGQVCHPQFSLDPVEGGGEKVCVLPGTALQSALCDFAGSGDMACASGHCEEVDIGGLGQFSAGICGECESDTDCISGECIPGVAELNLILQGSICAP